MEQVQKWKQRGNEFFKMQDNLKAINCWEEALNGIKNIEYERMQKLKAQGKEQEEIEKSLAELN